MPRFAIRRREALHAGIEVGSVAAIRATTLVTSANLLCSGPSSEFSIVSSSHVHPRGPLKTGGIVTD